MTSLLKESAVVILRLSGSDKILFLMRKEGWCLPGGKFESSDLTTTHCAVRELEEETSIKIKIDDTTLKYLDSTTSITGRVVHVFTAETPIKKVKISKEHSSYLWVSFDDIKNISLAGNTGSFISLYKNYDV